MLRRPLLLGLLLAGLPAARAATCPDRATLSELNRSMERAETAYGGLDLDGFMSASEALRSDLPCLGEPMTKVVAARLHRIEGLRGYVDNDRRAASQSFAAARQIDPAYSFPDTLVPEGYPEFELYNAIDLSLGASQKVDPMIDGYVLFDGVVGNARPTDWATIVQVIDEEGDINVTTYLRPGMPMPSYYPEATERAAAQSVGRASESFEDSAEEDPFAEDLDEDGPADWSRLATGEEEEPVRVAGGTVQGPKTATGTSAPKTATGTTAPRSSTTTAPRSSSTTAPRSSTTTPRSSVSSSRAMAGEDDIPTLEKEPKKRPVGLLTFSLLSAAASGVSYGVAMKSANEYRDEATTFEELDALRLQANLWSGVAAGTGLVALGTGIAVGVSW